KKPVTQTTSEARWLAGILQTKPTPAPKAQNPPIKLPEVPKPSSMIMAQNVNGKMLGRLNTPPRLNRTPINVALALETPEAPEDPKKCGTWRKMIAGCKDKKSKKSKNGGAVGGVESAAASKAKATIHQGVGRAIPRKQGLTMDRDAIFNVTLKRFLEPVGEYLDDDRVSEIMINGADEIYIERHGMIEKTDACFEDDEKLLAAARNIAQYTNKRITPLTARFDSRLPDGSRVHVVMPRCSRKGL